jgi:predicted dehydrogenase
MHGNALRWGILGTGSIARTFVTDLRLGGSGLPAAVGSRNQGSADRFAGEFEIPNRHGSYESLVADPSVDVVYVATPHPMHRDNAILALRAGKPVLVEKPMAMNGVEAAEIVTVARETGLFAMEAMWTRFLPHIAVVRDWLQRQVLGEIVTVASMVLGSPNRITAVSDPAFTGVDAQTSMVFGYESGVHALLTCTLRAKSPTRASIVGTEARIEIDGDFYAPAAVTLIPRDGEPTRVDSTHEGRGLRHQADEVARCLAAGKLESPVIPLDETVSIMQTMDTVRARAGARSQI